MVRSISKTEPAKLKKTESACTLTKVPTCKLRRRTVMEGQTTGIMVLSSSKITWIKNDYSGEIAGEVSGGAETDTGRGKSDGPSWWSAQSHGWVGQRTIPQ
jgi:hypothetical protein